MLAKFDLYYFVVCDRFQSSHHEHRQREANVEMQVENARFQRNARGVLVSRHVPESSDLRS